MKNQRIAIVITGVVVATVVSALVLTFVPEAQAGSSSAASGSQAGSTISMVVNTFEDGGNPDDTQAGIITINDPARRTVTVVSYWSEKNIVAGSVATILSPKKTFTY